MRKSIILLSLILTLVLMITGCSPAEEDLLDRDKIRVGMELKYPPFETVDSNGEPMGASVDLARALGDYLGQDVEIVDTPYPSLIPALMSSEVDIIISSMTITEDRAQRVDFSIPYTTSQLMMLVHKDSPVKSHEDLNSEDITIVSRTGTIGALWANTNAPKANVVNIDEESTAVLEVAQGRGDVFIYDPLSIIRHHENYPDSTRALLEPLPDTEGWGVAMRKDNDQLRTKINNFIEDAKVDGTYDDIREEHLSDQIEEFSDYGLDFFF